MTVRGRSLSIAARAYIAGVAALALALGILLWSAPFKPAVPVVFLLVSGLGMFAHAFPIPAARHQAYQATLPFLILAAAGFSTPQLIGFILLIHVAEQLRTRRLWYILGFNVCDYFVSAAAAGLLYRYAADTLSLTLLAQLEAALAAGCAFVLVNRALLAGALWLARGLSPARSGLLRPELLAADLIITWIAGPMIALASLAGPWIILFMVGPLFLARPALSSLLASEGGRPRPQPVTHA